MEEFFAWNDMRKQTSVLKAVKSKLHEITVGKLFAPPVAYSKVSDCEHSDKIQKVINVMAVKMRRQHIPGCQYIEAINDFMATRQKD